MSETELTPEQRAMVALLVAMKVPDPEAVVRAEPAVAQGLGAAIIPALRSLAESVAGLVDTFDRVIGSAGAALADEAERIANS
jgi:hypothetical protein